MIILNRSRIFAFLCDLALNNQSFKLEVNSASALANISTVLPPDILCDLIVNHNFIDIFQKLVGSEGEIYELVLLALRSIIDLIGGLPANDATAKLYFQLAESNLLNDVEQNRMEREEEMLFNMAESILQKAVVQRDRFSSFYNVNEE